MGDYNKMKIPKFEAQTEWVKPTEFPDLRQVDEIAIDLESVPKLISKPLKEKIKCDAQELNFMKRTTRAKLPV